MGLSSKQVSGDAFDWTKNLMQPGVLELPQMALVRQQQQQQQQMQVVPPLKCPRCDSTNTKFCYYNNYNRSQPRHFCKSCRRHWTKGGTLRNVPVGGGRKNKRQKTNTNATNNDNGISTNVQPHQQLQLQQQPVAFAEEKNLSEILYQSVIQPTADYINNSSYLDNMGTTLSLDSLVPLPNFPPTSLSTLDSNPSSSTSSRYQLPNMFSCTGKIDVLENPYSTIATTITTTTTTGMPMPWQIPVTSSSTDPSAYWSWEDLNTLVPNDIKVPWDDSQN